MEGSRADHWWQTGVIYQIYPRSFRDANGDGIGDLPGIIDRLDYLSETLAVDAVWLSPFYPSPQADFGYDVAAYCDVDPRFGTLKDFDALVRLAHLRGLKVIIDYVPNHTSDRHPWFVESRSSRCNPKSDWYIWRDPKPDGSPPNNWLSVFGGGAWQWDSVRRQFYLHTFLVEQPDLNWRHPEVEAAMFDVLRFWLDRGVDGFRIDTARAIIKDPELRDNPPNPGGGGYHKPRGEYDSQRHIHDIGHPDVHEVYRKLRVLLEAYQPPRVGLGEMHLYDWPEWVRYYGERLDELHMPINFALLNTPWRADAVRATVEALEAALPAGAWPNYVLNNHDEQRFVTRVGRLQARVAAVLLLTLRGTPTLYYGEELGMEEVEVPSQRQQDPWGLRSLPQLSRDGCRTPMQWNASASGGFSSAPPEMLWLPLGDDRETANVEHQLEGPHSMLSLYRSLLALRRARPSLHGGSYRTFDPGPDGCFAFLREAGDEATLVALNFTSAALSLWVGERGRLLLSSHLDREGEPAHGYLTLRPHEAVILAP
ncbi:MAG: alpha-amylase family glycosyl hydrolase [Pseudomonadales bacterium]